MVNTDLTRLNESQNAECSPTTANLRRVPRDFYRRHALMVAPDLLGLLLVHETETGVTGGLITEVEAYAGTEDPASHAFKGRRTKRNEVMYGPPGVSYVYFTYGMHYCFNIVVGEVGVPHAVLVRSILPVIGENLMEKRRHGRKPLSQGPGRLCQAMGIDTSHNGLDLVESRLFLAFPPREIKDKYPFTIETAPRVGIDYAGPARLYPWRFIARILT